MEKESDFVLFVLSLSRSLSLSVSLAPRFSTAEKRAPENRRFPLAAIPGDLKLLHGMKKINEEDKTESFFSRLCRRRGRQRRWSCRRGSDKAVVASGELGVPFGGCLLRQFRVLPAAQAGVEGTGDFFFETDEEGTT